MRTFSHPWAHNRFSCGALGSANSIVAEFLLPDDERHLLQASFDRQCIVRIHDTPKEGLVPEQFACRLEGPAFARIQSSAWKEFCAPVTHYQFVTGWACMDVLSEAAPVFSLVALSADATKIASCEYQACPHMHSSLA